MTRRRKIAKFFSGCLLIVLGTLVLFPVAYTIASSFMSPAEVQRYYQAVQNPVQGSAGARMHLIPDVFSLESFYQILLRRPDYLVKFWNSLLLCLGIVLGQLAVSCTGGFAFAKYYFRGKSVWFYF